MKFKKFGNRNMLNYFDEGNVSDAPHSQLNTSEIRFLFSKLGVHKYLTQPLNFLNS